MAPAPVSANQLPCDTVSDASDIVPSTLNVFEGPEKKLQLHFQPPTSISLPQDFPHDQTLRNLSRHDIEAILDAAACTILSMTSNDHVDAYLLSESSLFVFDYSLTIKTCGTTRLLHALPVILKLARDRVALEVTYVQYSRVSYLFPHAQAFPHDSFDNEVSFLDSILDTKGQVFMASLKRSSDWHLYFAHLSKSSEGCFEEHMLDDNFTDIPELHQKRQALEVYMFDLEPSVMNRFIFDDRPDLIGTDSPLSGTTSSTEITRLLLKEATVDAFNFEPCGYSMNALYESSYYTIHVSPEPGASYVSFETTAHEDHVPHMVAAVVKLFKPRHFTVALIESNRPHSSAPTIERSMSSSIMSKLLLLQSFYGDEPSVFSATEECQAVVTSFSSSSDLPSIPSPVSVVNSVDVKDDASLYLATVAEAYGAQFVDKCSIEYFGLDKPSEPEDEAIPWFVVDLGDIADNMQRIYGMANPKRVRLRYPVECNPDMAVLTLLSSREILFEVKNSEEIELLESLGVAPMRIILKTAILVPSTLTLLKKVGVVSLYGKTSDSILKMLHQSGVGVELRVDPFSIDELGSTLSMILGTGLSICSIAVENRPGSRMQEKGLALALTMVEKINKCLTGVPRDMKESIVTEVGELLWGDMSVNEVLGTAEVEERMRELLSRTPLIGINIGKLVVNNSVSLVTQVIGRRRRAETECEQRYSYYLNDGVYGAMSRVVMGGDVSGKVEPRALVDDGGDEELESTLFGPTCDALDRVWDGKLPLMDVGDRVVFADMGAYSWCAISKFNGFGMRYGSRYVVSGGRRCGENGKGC